MKHSSLSLDVTLQALETLLKTGRVKQVGAFWFAQVVWEVLVEEAVRLVREQHQQYPLRSGLSKEEWRTRLHLPPKMALEVFAALQAEGQLETAAGGQKAPKPDRGIETIRLPGFMPTFTVEQQQQVEQLLRLFRENAYTPPVRSEAEAIVGTEVLASLIEQGRLLKLGDSVLFLRETYEEALAKLLAYLREHGKITAAEARDVLGTTRKYILPLLEHMDERRLTRRVGDERILGTQA